MAAGEIEAAEMVLRLIRELEDRVRAREDTIAYLETVLSVRREETRLTHEELMLTDSTYRHTFYSIRALRGWQTRDRKEIERLKKLVPPIRALRLILTFSIETGTGHEPFYAEVTCETVTGVEVTREEERKVVERVVNAVVKFFWILFDANKCVTKDMKTLWGADLYEAIRRRKNFFLYQIAVSITDIGLFYETLAKHPYSAFEYAMDNFIKELIRLGCFTRSLDEFVTRQAILKIGLEVHYAEVEAEPKYPLVYLLIEKGRSKEAKADWVLGAKILIADETDVNIMEILDMGTEE